MMKSSSNLLFLMTLMIGTLMSISSNSWLGVWMGLEINLLSFIPLMSDNKNLMSNESSLKYFLTQAIASTVLLMSIIIMFLYQNSIMISENSYIYENLLLSSALFLKMGAAPFHFWLPAVMEGLSWFNNLILMTWQKIAPMILLSYCMNNNYLYFIIIFSIIIGSLGGLNQTSIRKIMAFSSINHIGWMTSALLFNLSLWWNYFLIYMFLSLGLVIMFNMFQLFYINQSFSMNSNNSIVKFIIFMNLLSLGGLPPFLGFLPKWLIIQNLINTNQFLLLSIMLIFTLITLFFYIRLTFSAFMLNYSLNFWNINHFITLKNKFILYFFTTISTMSLMIISLIFLIY
nr:NADH dehydrogenase subunit 2 [Coboldia fuscipes]